MVMNLSELIEIYGKRLARQEKLKKKRGLYQTKEHEKERLQTVGRLNYMRALRTCGQKQMDTAEFEQVGL